MHVDKPLGVQPLDSVFNGSFHRGSFCSGWM
jgi:hypothetical protein